MSVQVSEPAMIDSAAEDVFTRHRKHILSLLTPPPVSAPPEVHQFAASPAATDEDEAGDRDDADDFEDGLDAIGSPGYLQYRSDDDDDLADDDDDPVGGDLDDDDLPAMSHGSASRLASLRQQFQEISWRSPRVIITVLGAAVVLIAAVVWLIPDSGNKPTAVEIISATPSVPATKGPDVDAPIKIKSTSERCHRPGSTEPANAFDGSLDTAWKCERPIPGQILTIDLGEPNTITKITIVPGFNKLSSSGDEWTKYQTVTRVRFLFGPYSPKKPCTLEANNCLELNTNNQRDVVPIQVVPNKVTSTVKMVILQTTPPPADNTLLGGGQGLEADTVAVSEIQIIGHPAG